MTGLAPRRTSVVRRVPGLAIEVVRGRFALRALDEVGPFTRVVAGRPIVRNEGVIRIGRRGVLSCEYAPVDLRSEPGAVLSIGDHVLINYGTSMRAGASITIGDGASFGPYCVIDDVPLAAGGPDLAAARPIVIGAGCWLASRVTVEPGTTIGDGTVVTAGSVVSGEVPAGVVIGGSPARILRRLTDAGAGDGASERAGERAPVPTAVAPTAASSRAAAVGPTSDVTVGGLLISDFTIDPLVPFLAEPGGDPMVAAELAPFGLVVPSLLSPPPSGRDLAVVWARPEAVLASFRAVVAGRDATRSDVERDVDELVDLIAEGLGEFAAVFVPTFVQEPWRRGRGVADALPGGRAWALAIANARLVDRAADLAKVHVLDASRWISGPGGGHSERLWYSGKIPFVDQVFARAAADIRAAWAALQGQSRKLLVLDLDNTLWGGVVGDAGIDGIELGGHDAIGEAFVDFQHAIRALRERGVVLAIASKNEEATALGAIDAHEAMVLRRDDFVAWRIDWNDKAANIASIADELNLGLQSVVFIDDNPHERARVREALPAVLVPEWPVEPTAYVRALNELTCFDTAALTDEDRARTAMYTAERERNQLRSSVSSMDDWLRQLDITVRVAPLHSSNLTRATQLLNKTNQMNLSTRRMTESELEAWTADPQRRTITISVSDRLGDAGLTGLVSVERVGDTARIVDFILSCRVMGRQIERAMLAVAAEAAADLGVDSVEARIIDTAKNQPCRSFFESGVMTHPAPDRFTAGVADLSAFPDVLTRAGRIR